MTSLETTIRERATAMIGPGKAFADAAALDVTLSKLGEILVPFTRKTAHATDGSLSLAQAEEGGRGFNPTEALVVGVTLNITGEALQEFQEKAYKDFQKRGHYLPRRRSKPLLNERAVREDLLEGVQAVLAPEKDPEQRNVAESSENKREITPPPAKKLSQAVSSYAPRSSLPDFAFRPQIKLTGGHQPSRALAASKTQLARVSPIPKPQPSLAHRTAASPATATWRYEEQLPYDLFVTLTDSIRQQFLAEKGVGEKTERAIAYLEQNWPHVMPVKEAAEALRSGGLTPFDAAISRYKPSVDKQTTSFNAKDWSR